MSTSTERRSTNAALRPVDTPRQGFRTDIQALRAIAVLAVVVDHLFPNSLTGGYVGVDVFFVISGYLITSHLDREIVRTGRVRLRRFYARRVRRLLPAAFLVLLFSLVAAYLLLPFPRWQATALESFASATYWQNWLLAAKSVNYSEANSAASLVQHYWSLSVEEQFYLFWPLLLIGLFKIGRRRWVVLGVAIMATLSLTHSIYATIATPSEAYFITPVRVWEFGVGAGVALAAGKLVLPRVLAGLAAFAGFAMILFSAVAHDHHTPFPGWTALVPAIGTGLVITSGLRPGPQWHDAVTGSRPVQFIGDISYSLYLWHWPLLLLAPFVVGGRGKPGVPVLLGVLAASLLLAYLSKIFVEDRGMSWGPLVRSSRLTLVGMAVGLVAVSVLAGALQWTYVRHVAQSERDAAAGVGGPCHGASAMIPTNGCPDPFAPARTVAMGPANEYWRPAPECRQQDTHRVGHKLTTSVCDFSGGAPAAEKVWLIGDSHAQQWQTPVFELARERKWVLKLGLLGGCPFADVKFTGYRAKAPAKDVEQCAAWNSDITRAIVDDKPSVVLTSFFARKESVDDGSGRDQVRQYRDGLESRWRRFTDAGARVVVLADPPYNGEVRSPDCVVLNAGDPGACAVDRGEAQPSDPLTEAARATGNPRVSLVDLTDYFCDERKCHAVVGRVAVYYDQDHVNAEFSRTLKPMLAEVL